MTNTRSPLAPALYRIAEVAQLLAISRAGVYRLLARGELPSVVVGDGARRIPAAAVDAYIATVTS